MIQTPKRQGAPWKEEEAEFLYEQRCEAIPYAVIAKKLGRTIQACEDKFRKTDWEANDIAKKYKFKMSLRQKRSDAISAQSEMHLQRSFANNRMRADVISDKILQAARELPEPSLEKWEPKSRKGLNKTDEDMVLILSDLHVGQEHSLEETGGMSEYNVDIFRERMSNLKYAVADIYEIHSHMYKIPRLHIFCLGDLVAGMNDAGAWSHVYINSPIHDQSMIAHKEISDAILYWLQIYEEVHFYGVRGNHGRLTKNGNEKDYCNWDNVIYEFLQLEFRNNERVKFHVSKCWWRLEEIRGFNFLLVHGDDVKSKNPQVLGLMSLEKDMTCSLKKTINYTICGHFHNCGEFTSHNGKLITNGAFPGADTYSLRNNFPGTQPEQKVFGVHPDHGITYTYNINLNHKRKKSDTHTKLA